jgi:predicted ATP-dependent protease
VPIKQSIAVTGSVNQKGEIQPIGGVNEKIEGYFELCKLRGLDGTHGVIIPYRNIRNLNLHDEVVEAVEKGKFNVYAVKTIDEGMEILTGMKFGEKGEDGTYPPGTINYLVYEKLKKYALATARFGRESEE